MPQSDKTVSTLDAAMKAHIERALVATQTLTDSRVNDDGTVTTATLHAGQWVDPSSPWAQGLRRHSFRAPDPVL